MSNNEKSKEPDQLRKLAERLSALEREVKRREFLLPRAVKTLWNEWDRGEENRKAALHGLGSAAWVYFRRRRVAIIVGSILATLLAGWQGYLLWWQNQLVSQQNEYIEQQTRASQGQSVNFLLSTLTSEDDVKNEVALVQLIEYGEPGFDAITRLASTSSKYELKNAVWRVLLNQGNEHSPSQISRVLTLAASEMRSRHYALSNQLSRRIEYEGLERIKYENSIVREFRRHTGKRFPSAVDDYLRDIVTRTLDSEMFRTRMRQEIAAQPESFYEAVSDIIIYSSVLVTLQVWIAPGGTVPPPEPNGIEPLPDVGPRGLEKFMVWRSIRGPFLFCRSPFVELKVEQSPRTWTEQTMRELYPLMKSDGAIRLPPVPPGAITIEELYTQTRERFAHLSQFVLPPAEDYPKSHNQRVEETNARSQLRGYVREQVKAWLEVES